MNAFTAVIVCLVVVFASVLHGTFMAHRRRAGLARAQARFDKQRHALAENLDAAKRQVAQLQNDLSAARREVERLARERTQAVAPPRATPTAAREQLARVLADDAPTPRAPAHGFANTLPALMFAEDAGLLIR